ncbi:MAG: DUF4954 family protein [Bacteroidales bacterium]|nr:DUF4954 family protein [Bacteroidales bacterium]
MMNYRKLTSEEIEILKSQMCTSDEWESIEVSEDFVPKYVRHTRFSGKIRLGAFRKVFSMPGGMCKHSGLYYTTLHNVTVGDDCCIENVKNYIANYEIGHDTFIENVDIILTDGVSSFGNGVEVAVLNETGGREVMIFDRLTAQTAYVMALYRHRPEMVAKLREMINRYVESVSSSVGYIGSNVTIVDSGYIKNVKIGDCCKIEGASRLKNGSINSNEAAPVHVGVGVIGDDFIICSGSSVKDGVTFSRCFVGQACKLGHNYSATDSLFFSNCQGENGEACAIFAGPYTVTHHKSTLLIAGMFSFMNAGSGSNQSNHMYKLGPIHQGIMERGAKTSSDSYLLWPAKVGAFSLVMGRHVSHQDTSNLPFSYLIEQQNVSYIMPGANLKSVGTIRDAKKWPGRDGRKDPDKLDQINYNLLSPYTIQKMLNGVEVLKQLQTVSGMNSDTYTYQSGKIKSSSLKNGLKYYGMAIDKFLGNSLLTRIMNSEFKTIDDLRKAFEPKSVYGEGDWVDISGMIAPKEAVTALLDDIQSGVLTDIAMVNERFAEMHGKYYFYEWRWAHKVIQDYYGVNLSTVTAEKLRELVNRWKSSVVGLDNLIYEDARKEFSLSAMTSFGADGDEAQRKEDFMQVRGSFFEADPFVKSVKDHIRIKSDLGDRALEILHRL